MRKLYIDIENTPHTVHRWGMFDSNPVYPAQLLQPSRLLCFAASWEGSKTTQFYSSMLYNPDSPMTHQAMVDKAHTLLSQADVVVQYNGRRHDLPLLNREFALYGMHPPAPYISVDLYSVVKRRFKFPFGKLDYVCQELGVGSKVKHEGHELWIKCMAGDPKAWKKMSRYNRGDVQLLKDLDEYLKAWGLGAVNVRLTDDDGNEEKCPTCGSNSLVREGYALTTQGKYQRFHCRECGSWSRSSRRESGTGIRGML